jgi:hypothetical protein
MRCVSITVWRAHRTLLYALASYDHRATTLVALVVSDQVSEHVDLRWSCTSAPPRLTETQGKSPRVRVGPFLLAVPIPSGVSNRIGTVGAGARSSSRAKPPIRQLY